jgi:hypothetical protein
VPRDRSGDNRFPDPPSVQQDRLVDRLLDLTEDAFRALARSSPWRWRTLHFVYADDREQVEAWLRRPGQLLVRAEGRRDFRVDDRVEDKPPVALTSVLLPSRGGSRTEPAPQPEVRWPHEVAPIRRDDGLVRVRPSALEVAYDDPMYQSYDWVAMLDPVELSHHTATTRLRVEERLGRRTWRARVRPEEGYEPRCGCCPLLWSFISDRDESADEDQRGTWQPPMGTVYPREYDVALDVQTGVVVERSPVGRSSLPIWHRLELLEVDADLDRFFARA